MRKNNRVGEKFVSNEGYSFVIVEYNKYEDVIIEFCDKHKSRVHTQYTNCKKGSVKNPYHPSVHGHGYLGLMSDGTRPKTRENGKATREYEVWSSMLARCYSEKYHEKQPTYRDSILEEELHCFAFFLEFVIKNIPNYEYWLNHPNEGVALDKDIRGKGSKVYSRDTIMFVTRSENCRESNKRNPTTKVYGINIKTNEKTKVFNSVKEASCELDICCSSISACLNSRQKTAGGYTWHKVDDKHE